MMKQKLVLENGLVFEGIGYGLEETIGEVVFNTSMVGYQEIITDPSYFDQIVVLTYPLIGNYGINHDDYESKRVNVKGLIVKNYNDNPSNFRSTSSLKQLLDDEKIAFLTECETRSIVKVIRDQGTMKGIITSFDTPHEACMLKIKNYQAPHKQARFVSTKEYLTFNVPKPNFHVVCVDFGAKSNIIKKLNEYHFNVTVVPHDIKVADMLKLNPDGIIFSNGPGNPEDNHEAIELIKALTGKVPMVGICLGHQLMALAHGAKTYKMRFGHRGSNHPIRNLETDKIEITAQNHAYAVDWESIKKTHLKVTHVNLLDETIEGVEDVLNCQFSIQYHPESSAGPEDSTYLFEKFATMMREFKERDDA